MSRDFNEMLLADSSFMSKLKEKVQEMADKSTDGLNEEERSRMPYPGPAMAGLDTAQWETHNEDFSASDDGISFISSSHNSQPPFKFDVANGRLVGEIGNLAAVRFALSPGRTVNPKKKNGVLVWWTRSNAIVFRKWRAYSARGHQNYHDRILEIIKSSYGDK